MEYKTIMELLMKEQFKAFSRLKKLQKFFKENPSVLKGDIDARIELVSTYYKQFCEDNEKIENISSKHDINITNEDYIKEDLAFKCELLFLEIKGKLLEDQSAEVSVPKESPIPKKEDKSKEKKSAEASVPKESPIPKKEDKSKEKKSATADFPKIDVLKFSGEFTDWLEFRSEYCDLVHSNTVLTNSQKFGYLKLVLPNEVFEWIKDLYQPGKKNGYVVAWKVLEEKFNKRALVEAYLTKLMQQPSKKVSAENIDQLLHATHKCLQGLQSLNVDTKNWDLLLIHFFVQKLDEGAKIEWNNSDSCQKIPKLDNFFEFLKAKHLNDKPSDETKKLSVGTNNSYQYSCVYCKQKHPLRLCEEFKSLSVEKRYDFVQNKNFCVRCLAANHTILSCKKEFRCLTCQSEEHHVLLHKDK